MVKFGNKTVTGFGTEEELKKPNVIGDGVENKLASLTRGLKVRSVDS